VPAQERQRKVEASPPVRPSSLSAAGQRLRAEAEEACFELCRVVGIRLVAGHTVVDEAEPRMYEGGILLAQPAVSMA